MNETTIYAEDVGNYWQTSRTAPDTWISKAQKEITAIGGTILGEAYGSQNGRAAFMLEFQLGADRFKVIWPVMPSRTGKDFAAKVQAATMLYHDVKSKCMSAKVLGSRTAFFSFLVLPNGQTASQISSQELLDMTPALLLPSGG